MTDPVAMASEHPAAAPAPAIAAGRPAPFAARLRGRWPGALLCAVIALAASFIARVHGGPPLLYALLFGVSFHFLHEDARIRPGIDLCTAHLLRLGVALLGARITLGQIASLGWVSAAVVVVAVASTIAGGLWLARRLGLPSAQGLLSGGATAICGASAALAIAAVLPRSREQERFTLLVVVAVTTLSTLAMLVYPLLAHALALPAAQAGLFLGGSIHDVAQVVAAGYLMDRETGDAAVVVKLLRVAMLALVVVAATLAFGAGRRGTPGGPPRRALWSRTLGLVPWFLWAFAGLVLLQSAHGLPPGLAPVLDEVSRGCLVLAIAGLGIKTSFQSLLRTGWRPLALLLCETLWLAAVMLAAAGWLQRAAAA